MSERDDLARFLHWEAFDWNAAETVADAIIAAGWIRPVASISAGEWGRLTAQRDALAATVERVRALCDEWSQHRSEDQGYMDGLQDAAHDLRAALDDNGGSE